MSLIQAISINSTTLLDPNTFQVDENIQYETLTNMAGDDVIIERKGTNYRKASINIEWQAVPVSYLSTIKSVLSGVSLHTITRAGITYSNLKLESFSQSLVDELRERVRNGEYYYNVSATFVQTISTQL